MNGASWLVGETPRPLTIGVAGVLGLSFALAVTLSHPTVWSVSLLLMVTAFDLVAGLVSNLSTSTQVFWRSRAKPLQVTYVLVHALAYPLLLWSITGGGLVWWLLLTVLAAKTTAFVRGLRSR
jgi:hypothetical protein